MSIVIPPSLDKKYAILWHDTNHLDKIPLVLRPFSSYGKLTRREKELYSTALWKVLDMMADDGLIKQETLRKIHDEENGWIKRSSISVGKVPEYVWIGFGLAVGLLIAGGFQLIFWLFRILL